MLYANEISWGWDRQNTVCKISVLQRAQVANMNGRLDGPHDGTFCNRVRTFDIDVRLFTKKLSVNLIQETVQIKRKQAGRNGWWDFIL
jgi:hypothetical protein